jgi:uncharacterized protein (DUF1800 family)
MSTLSTVDPDWAWAPYEPSAEQPWDARLAAHLFRRAGFGATDQELNEAVAKSPSEVISDLVARAVAGSAVDVSADPLARAMLATGNARSLAAWWLHRMLNTETPLLEKLTLFWHGHFATGADKVTDSALMFAQNQLLRRHSLGSFSEIAHAIARDPAMLIYLDSATNRKAHPNENFARELMELFCLGEGNYSEKDVQELARCFTGWEVRRDKFRFNRYQHDSGQKSILGQQGEFSGEDGVDIVLAQSSCPEFIVGKLIRFFMFAEPAATPELIAPLAQLFRDSDLQNAPVIERLLGSNLFFSEHSIARRLRSPVELLIGLLRSLEATTNLNLVADGLHELGHSVFYPPNVKGWDGGRTWINTSTLLGRANLIGSMLHSDKTRFAGGDLASLTTQNNASQPEALLAWLERLLLAISLPTTARQSLLETASNSAGNKNDRIATVIHTLSALPVFQLA